MGVTGKRKTELGILLARYCMGDFRILRIELVTSALTKESLTLLDISVGPGVTSTFLSLILLILEMIELMFGTIVLIPDHSFSCFTCCQ